MGIPVLAGLNSGFLNDLLLFFGQALVNRIRNDEGKGHVVAGDLDAIGEHLIKAIADHGGDIRAANIDNAGLCRGIHIAERNIGGSAKCRQCSGNGLIAGNAQNQAIKIRHSSNGLFGPKVHLASGAIAVAEHAYTSFLHQGLTQLGTDLAIIHIDHIGGIIIEPHVISRVLGADLGKVAHADNAQINRTKCNALDHIRHRAKLAGGEHLNIQGPAGALIYKLRKIIDGLHFQRIGSTLGADLQDDRFIVLRRGLLAAGHQGKHHNQREHQADKFFHNFLQT